jgi:hypothetical protein
MFYSVLLTDEGVTSLPQQSSCNVVNRVVHFMLEDRVNLFHCPPLLLSCRMTVYLLNPLFFANRGNFISI